MSNTESIKLQKRLIKKQLGSTPSKKRFQPWTAFKAMPVTAKFAVIWITLLVIATLTAGILPIPDPTQPFYDSIGATPTLEHPLGTDQLGRDILSRIIWGARASLQIGMMAVLLGMTIGVALGLLAGYYGGWVNTAISAVADIVLAFPTLILIMVLVAIRGASAPVLVFGIGIVMVPTFIRLARANTLVWAKRDFVTASVVLGSRQHRVILREVLPNVLPPVLAYAFIVVSVVMVAEGSLSFLGYGLQAPTPSWGNMIAQARNQLAQKPHMVAFPALALFFTVAAFNYLGDYFRGRTGGRTEVNL